MLFVIFNVGMLVCIAGYLGGVWSFFGCLMNGK